MIEKEYGPQSVSLESLVGLPRGLNEAYKAFLKRIFPNLEQFESYKRLLGILAVSFDSLREAKLARLTGRPREVDTIQRQLSRLS